MKAVTSLRVGSMIVPDDSARVEDGLTGCILSRWGKPTTNPAGVFFRLPARANHPIGKVETIGHDFFMKIC